MSRVSECLKQILSARYGKDVRQSIHDGIKELDEVARTAQGSATLSAQTAIEKANEALTASQAAIESAQQAKAYSDNAQAVAGVQVATQDNAGLVKGGENHIGLDGTLELVVKTTETSMPNSRKGRLAVDEIGGVCVQDNIPSSDYPQEIKKSVVSEIRTHGKNFLNARLNVEIGSNDMYLIGNIVENETYTFYLKQQVTQLQADRPTAQHYYWFLDKDNKVIQQGTVCYFTFGSVNQIMEQSTLLTAPSGAKHLRLDLGTYFTNSNTKVKTIEAQVEVGKKFTGYEPYTEYSITLSQPIDLNATGNVQDVIDVEHGAIIRNAGELDLEDLTWTRDEEYNLWISSGFNKAKNDTILMCETIPYARCTTGNAVIGTRINSPYNIWVRNGSTEISPSGKAIYELATPTTEELPIADQIALNSLKTFEGVTYIEFVSEVQPTFKGKYGASLVGGIALEAYNQAHTHSRTVLWTNSDKTKPIEARTVLLPLSLDDYEQYEFYLVTYCNSTASEFAEKQVLMARAAGTYNGNNVILGAVIKEGDTYHQHERNLAYSFDSNAFTVAQCTYLDASFKAQAAHDKLIPYQIIGIK